MNCLRREPVTRKRRVYTKSRYGCKNCKLRRVKCDETKPRCRKCENYGVECNFMTTTPDLQVLARKACPLGSKAVYGVVDMAPKAQSPLSLLGSSHGMPMLNVDPRSTEIISRFRSRVLSSLGNRNAAATWDHVLLPAVHHHAFFMHVVLALAASHERCVELPPGTRRTVCEMHHSSQGVVTFNSKLCQPLDPQDYDTLWATAALLSILVFSAVEAADPEDAWPLRPASPSDLEWLTLRDGKMVVWNLTNPLRPGGIFRAMAADYAEMHSPLPEFGIDGVAPELARVCGLAPDSSVENNAYFAEAHCISRLRNCRTGGMTRSLTFMAHMQTSYKALLRKKEPVALLLLALWYDEVKDSSWWIHRRAEVEMKATCMYLRRFHSDRTNVLALLPDVQPPPVAEI